MFPLHLLRPEESTNEASPSPEGRLRAEPGGVRRESPSPEERLEAEPGGVRRESAATSPGNWDDYRPGGGAPSGRLPAPPAHNAEARPPGASRPHRPAKAHERAGSSAPREAFEPRIPGAGGIGVRAGLLELAPHPPEQLARVVEGEEQLSLRELAQVPREVELTL